MMSLSSACCLKRISQHLNAGGYMEVSDARIREACLANNFDVIFYALVIDLNFKLFK